MSKSAVGTQEGIATEPAALISGPHPATDATGEYYEYYACESCALESTDRRMQDGCLRCSGGI